MQDEVVFPEFGIKSEIFWRRCSELVRDHGYDNELAYMKVLPEMFEEFRGGEGLLTAEHAAHGITVEHYIYFVGVKGVDRWQPARALRSRHFRLRIRH